MPRPGTAGTDGGVVSRLRISIPTPSAVMFTSAVTGDPAACRKQIQAFFDAGVQEVRLVFNEPSKDAYLESLRAVAPGSGGSSR